MKEVESSSSYVNGEQVYSNSTSQLVQRPGNCVFATRPFGAEGVINSGLVFRIVGRSPVVYARCYLNSDPAAMSSRDGVLYVAIVREFDQAVLKLPPTSNTSGKHRYVDFTLRASDLPFIDLRKPFQNVMVSVYYEFTRDLVVVWDENAARLRKQRDGKELAASQLFWDRDGTPPISANSRSQK
jgi:hypothetical protein